MLSDEINQKSLPPIPDQFGVSRLELKFLHQLNAGTAQRLHLHLDEMVLRPVVSCTVIRESLEYSNVEVACSCTLAELRFLVLKAVQRYCCDCEYTAF
jgi:hypothetical protein